MAWGRRSWIALSLVAAGASVACDDVVARPIRAASLAPDAGQDSDGALVVTELIPDSEHCQDARRWPADFARAELELLDAINERRERGVRCGDNARDGLQPLDPLGKLWCSARLRSRALSEDRDTSWDGQDESVWDRAQRAGLELDHVRDLEEAGAQAGPQADQALGALLADRSDCFAIADRDITSVGIGYYLGRWALDFAELEP